LILDDEVKHSGPGKDTGKDLRKEKKNKIINKKIKD